MQRSTPDLAPAPWCIGSVVVPPVRGAGTTGLAGTGAGRTVTFNEKYTFPSGLATSLGAC